MGISTHVLDTAAGRPAAGMRVTLETGSTGEGWATIAAATTDDDGRVPTLVAPEDLEPGTYRLRFDTAGYFAGAGSAPFFPHVEITFRVGDVGDHYHVPLLLSPFGYTTYRGS